MRTRQIPTRQSGSESLAVFVQAEISTEAKTLCTYCLEEQAEPDDQSCVECRGWCPDCRSAESHDFHCPTCKKPLDEAPPERDCRQCNGKCDDCCPIKCVENHSGECVFGCEGCMETLDCGHGPFCQKCAAQGLTCDTCGHRQCDYCITKAYRGNCDCPRRWPRDSDDSSSSDELESGW